MSINYPVFTFNNESVIIRPGREFSKNELNSRLHQMGIQLNETKDKNTMAGLYDSYLQNNQNKLKIFNILRKDTQMRNSRLGLTQRESVPPSNNMSNVSKNKHMNISNEVRPFEQGNRRVQEINISQKIYTNKPEYTPNTFVSNNMNQEQDNETVDYRYPNNVNQKSVEQSFSNSRNFQNPNILNVSHRPEFNNYQNLDNSKNNYNNTSNNANYPSFNNENSIRVRENNNSINEKIYTNKGTPFYNQPQEFNSSNLRNSNSNQFRNNNYNNYNNNYNNNYSNNNNYNSGNMNQNSQRMNIEPNHQPPVSYRQEISSGINNNNINQRREPDEESEFSVFSTLRKLPLYKNRKHICVNIVLSLLIICLVIGFLKLINTYWDSITDYFSELWNRGFVDAIFGFISSVFFGAVNYFYITIPLIILIFLFVLALKNFLISKRCEEIFNNIVNDLRNGTTRSGNRYLSYDDMFRDYAMKYGISKEEFQKKYIKELERKRRKKSGMKKSNLKDNNGNDIIIWEYDN